MPQCFSFLGYVAALGGALLLIPPSMAIAHLTGNVSLTSDYVWCGSSQTCEKPVVQAGIKYAHDSGFYASVWGSNVKFNPENYASSEFDIALGWSGKLAEDLTLDENHLNCQYFSVQGLSNWNEAYAGLTLRDDYWLAVWHSTNTMASKTTDTHTLIDARYQINKMAY